MSLLKKVSVFVSLTVATLFLALVYKAYVINRPCEHRLKKLDEKSRFKLDKAVINRLRSALTYQTVSYDIDVQNETALLDYINYVRREFNDIESLPFVSVRVLSNFSLLYEIKGTESELKPYLFAAHSDVVPANPQSDRWTFDPFSGHLSDDGFIYGRGTLDCKSSMIGQLEAVRAFVRLHGQPKRTLYLAYGHDEEVSGKRGAAALAAHLTSQHISLEYVLDEGVMIIEDLFADIDRPVGLIGVADKGYLSLRFSVNTTGGHSSVPNEHSSPIFILAEAVSRLRHNKQPSFLGIGPEKNLFESIALYVGFAKRVVLSNLWLFKPIAERFLTNTNLDTLQRTTTSITMFHSGIKDNVIPSYAEFVVNHRIHSLQSCKDVLEHDVRAIDDERVQYEVLNCEEPTAISSTDSLGFRLVEHTTMQIFENVAAVPGIMIALTDGRFYTNLTNSVYRFLPIKLFQRDVSRYHGIDERISLKNYEDLINFFFVLMVNSNTAHLELDFYKNNEL